MDAVLKSFLKEITPPILGRLYRSFLYQGVRLSGTYASWQEASGHATGYDADLILERVKQALLKVKRGEAVFERDSVLFDEIQYSWPVLAGLLRIAAVRGGNLSVLDFGGSLGSSYYQCRDFLSGGTRLRWSVVEQRKFVDCGRQYFESGNLKFYYTIEECLEREQPDVILLSSVLQYIEAPHDLMQKVIGMGFESIIVDRMPFGSMDSDILTVQHVPKEIYPASYPFWLFNEQLWLKAFKGVYNLLARFPALDGVWGQGDHRAEFKGFIFQQMENTAGEAAGAAGLAV